MLRRATGAATRKCRSWSASLFVMFLGANSRPPTARLLQRIAKFTAVHAQKSIPVEPSSPVRMLTDNSSSATGQTRNGKNGTSAAILGKRRLVGEYIVAVCNTGIWRMSDDAMKRHAPKLMTDHGVRQQGECHEPTEQPKALDWSCICCRDRRLGQRLRPARAAWQVELRAGRDHRAVLVDPRAVVSAETIG